MGRYCWTQYCYLGGLKSLALMTGLAEQVFLTPTHLAIVMEYAQGGDLVNYMLSTTQKRLGESEARWIFQQLVIGLDYCHRRVRLG